MTKHQAFAFYGSQLAVAKKLGLKQPTVCQWKKIPLEHQIFLERDSGGELKADRHPAEERAA